MEFSIRDKKIFVKGKAFELDIADNGDEKELLSIYKELFHKIDIESYNVKLGDDKIVFISKDSDTTAVISLVVKDEKYEEESSEFE